MAASSSKIIIPMTTQQPQISLEKYNMDILSNHFSSLITSKANLS